MPFPDFQTKLQGWWKGDDIAGTTAFEWSGNRLDGTMTGGPTFTNYGTGKIYGAMSFDGVDDRVVVPHVNNNPLDIKGSAITVSFWMKATVWPGDGTLTTVLAKQHNAPANYPSWTFYAGFGGTINFGISVGGVGKTATSAINLAAGTWYHVVGTYDGANVNLYVSTTSFNSTPTGTVVGSGTIDGSTADLWFAGNPTFSAGRYYNGLLDDVRIYSRALSTTDLGGLFAWNDNTPAPNAASLAKFRNFSTIGSCHYGLSSYLTIAAVPSEWGDGTAPVSTLNYGSSINWTKYLLKQKALGCKATLLTSKHLEGFCLWPSTITSDYCVSTSGVPVTTDLVNSFLTAARSLNMGVGLYFCVYDAFQKTKAGGYNAKYRDAIIGMLGELMTLYGSLDFILLDGWGYTWPAFNGPSFDPTNSSGQGGIPLSVIYNYITDRQPNCLVGVNDHTFAYGDYFIAESSEPASTGLSSKPVMWWQPIQSTNPPWFWFQHSDSVPENVTKSIQVNLGRRDRTLANGYIWSPNIPLGGNGLLEASVSSVLDGLAIQSSNGTNFSNCLQSVDKPILNKINRQGRI